MDTKWIQNGNKLDTQYSIDKNSIDKNSIDKNSEEYIEQKQDQKKPILLGLISVISKS